MSICPAVDYRRRRNQWPTGRDNLLHSASVVNRLPARCFLRGSKRCTSTRREIWTVRFITSQPQRRNQSQIRLEVYGLAQQPRPSCDSITITLSTFECQHVQGYPLGTHPYGPKRMLPWSSSLTASLWIFFLEKITGMPTPWRVFWHCVSYVNPPPATMNSRKCSSWHE